MPHKKSAIYVKFKLTSQFSLPMSQHNSSRSSLLKTGLAAAGIASAATLAATAAANALIAAKAPPLGLRLNGQFARYPSRHGDLAYVVAGSGSPVLLLHGLQAGRSMAEWSAVFDHLADHHTVYAFDFLGWGLSDAPTEGYSADSFAEAIEHFIADVIEDEAAVLGAGAGAIFAVLAAARGAQISKLALVCPVPPGGDVASGQSRAERKTQKQVASALLKAPILGQAALNYLNSRANLGRWANGHGFFDAEREKGAVNLFYAGAHRKGAEFGQRALLEGDFECDWRAAWEKVEVPTLLVWGRNALRDGYDAAPEWLALQPETHLEVVENALLLPHWEQAERFERIVAPFLKS